tara:strand:+ start:1278 stop:1505 length:228 start_codon:yes stop_codon:yes gene_type:complete
MMEAEVINIVSNILNIKRSKITENSGINTIEQWDSLKHMQIISAIEEEYKIEFSEEQLIKSNNVKKLINSIKKNI